jgi:hypothetical protein
MYNKGDLTTWTRQDKTRHQLTSGKGRAGSTPNPQFTLPTAGPPRSSSLLLRLAAALAVLLLLVVVGDPALLNHLLDPPVVLPAVLLSSSLSWGRWMDGWMDG